MDGAAHVTQDPIENGGIYHYEFTVVQHGTYLYHSHDHVDRQQALGLYGAMIIDPAVRDPSVEADHDYIVLLQEWLKREGLTFPAMPMDGGQPNYFTINGRAYPATDNDKGGALRDDRRQGRLRVRSRSRTTSRDPRFLSTGDKAMTAKVER